MARPDGIRTAANRARSTVTTRSTTTRRSIALRIVLFAATFASLFGVAGRDAFADPPYPRLMTTVWYNPEPKDFAAASKFDAVEFFWTDILREPGFADSCRAMKARNPNLKVIGVVSCDMNCTNWSGRNDVMYEWTEQLDANAAMWYLRDTDGDHWKRTWESDCDEGWMNWTQQDMCVAFAEYLYDKMFVQNPGVFDGIHGDHLLRGISWANADRWVAGGVGYIDSDRNGIADGDSALDYWWKEGTNAFCQRFDELIGTQDIIIFANGGVPARSYQWTNGRFHEGFPGPIGGTPPDWYASVVGPQYGYLNEEDWYSADPQQMLTLQGLNFWPVDCDPSRLSTTETPYNLPCVQPVIDLTLASALLGDGYSCVTGWARNSDGDVLNYHTTWWLPLYDSLRVNLGQPLGAYYDTTGNFAWQDAYIRQYEGGMAKVLYPASSLTASGYLELRPKAAFRQPVATTWPIGSAQTIRFRGWDPLNVGMSSVRVLLSRNGGTSFPETLGVYGPNDSLATITVSGPAAASCRVRIESKDITGWIGGVTSGNVAITGTASSIDAVAEAVPRTFTAGAAVSLNLHTRLNQAGSGGVGEIRLVRPASFSSWQATAAFLNGNPLVGTISTAGDTIRIVSTSPLVAGSVVRVALNATASQVVNPGTAVKDFAVPWGGGTPVAAVAGNADGINGNSESLTIVVNAGPLARIIVAPPNATMNVSETRQFTASGRDAYDNAVPVTATWSATGGIGSITTGGLFTAMTPGSGLVIGASGAIRDSAEVTVNGVTPIAAVAEAVPRVFAAGAAVSLNLHTRLNQAGSGGVGEIRLVRPVSFSSWQATAAYLNGNPLAGTISTAGDTIRIISTAPLVAGSVVRVALNATASQAVNPGTAVKDFAVPWGGGTPVAAVAGNADGINGNSESLTIVVNAGPLARIIVAPPNATMNVSDTRQFSASGRDAYDNPITVTATWSVTAGIGSITTGGLFTATTSGSGLVIGASGAIRDSAEVTVNSNTPITALGEAVPRVFTAGAAVSFNLFTRLDAAGSGGVGEIRLVRPASLASWQATGAFVNGVPFSGSIVTAGDTIRVVASSAIVTGSLVRVALNANASQSANPGAAVKDFLIPWGGGAAVAAVAGNADGIGGNSESLTIVANAGPLARIIVAPPNATVVSGQTQAFTASGRDAYDNPIVVTPGWSVTGGIGTITTGGVFSATTPGSGLVIAALGAMRDSAEVTVVPSAPSTLVISPDSAIVAADGTRDFDVAAYDAQGNPIAVTGTWSVIGTIGTISQSGLFTPSLVGTGWVRCTAAGLVDSAGVTVVVGAPSAITVTPSTATIPADSSRLFTAIVTDADGNVRNDPVSWRVRGTIGIVNQAGRFTPTSLGSGWVVGTSGAFADSSQILVVVGSPAVITISPDSAAIPLGGEVLFTAQVYDSRGNALPPQLSWSAAGACSLLSPGRVRGRAIGDGRVFAIQGAAKDTAHVTVAGPPPNAPDRFVTITAPPDFVRVSPSGDLDTLHVEARVSIGGLPDTSVTEEDLRLLITGGGGACAPETLAAEPIAGEPGAFAFEAAALGGCGTIDFDLIVEEISAPMSAAAELRSPDVDGDGAIGLFDAALFLPGYHSGAGGCADQDADGALAVDDLDWFVAEFRKACGAGAMLGGGGASGARTSSESSATLRISGTRAPDTLGLAAPGYDIIDATLVFEGAAGLSALDLSMNGAGEVIDLSDPPASDGGLIAYPLALEAGECLSVLWIASDAPDSSASTAIGEIKLAIPSGVAPEDFVTDVSLVDASYGILEWAGVEWEIASAPVDTGGSPPDTSGGSPPDSSGGSPPDSSGGSPPDSSGGSPPDSTGGSPPDSTGGSPPDSTGGSPPDSTGGSPPDSTGSPPDSTGGAPDDTTDAPVDSTLGIGDDDDPPDDPPIEPPAESPAAAYKLYPPSPNPARDDVRIRFAVPPNAAGPVRVSLYDTAGRLIAVVADGALGPGEHEAIWIGDDGSRRASAGVYFVRLEAQQYSETQRVIRIR